MSLLVAIPYFSGDVNRTKDLLLFMAQLGGCKQHPCVLVADADTPWQDGLAIRNLASDVFASVATITNAKSVPGWIPGSVSLFWSAMHFCSGNTWLWLEPDCIPLKATWLDDIEAAYEACGKPFMGCLVEHQRQDLPSPYMEGCAVYPPDAAGRMAPLWDKNKSWVYACAEVVVPNCHHSPLFHFIWGEMNRPPVFADEGIPHTNVFGLNQIKPEAVLFHRNKDGSLIRLMRKALGLPTNNGVNELAVVCSFCVKDERLMHKSIAWISELCGQLPRRCILHYDANVSRSMASAIQTLAGQAFRNVEVNVYPTPRHPFIGWPRACNFSFTRACQYMAKTQQSWLWFEADCVALTADWLYQIESEYKDGGLPFMGIIIEGMGHMNGTGVYPWNAGDIIPRALSQIKDPWDTAMKEEMIVHCHPGNRVMQHCGAVVDGCCRPTNGAFPAFPTAYSVQKLIQPGAVFFHPSKKGDLIDRLREMQTV